jgi:hypothetical protein
MLFDLRGRHRRRAVRIIYTGLAVLMGVGLVGFGIGGGFNSGGGLLNAASNNEGGNAASFASQIKKYEKQTRLQPNNASAWENLTSAELHEAGGEAFVNSTGVTSRGKELFAKIAHSWNSYLALNPAKPNTELAQRMLTVFSEEGLNEPASAAQVLQIAVVARPTSASLFAKLAEYDYKAHNTREGDLAAAKAISLVPATERTQLKLALAQVKKKPNGSTTETSTSPTGQPFTVTHAANGRITAKPIPKTTTQPPAGTSSTKKP